MGKSKKLTKDELTQVQSMLNAFNQLKMQLGDAVLQQTTIVQKIDGLKVDYAKVEKQLSEKYGTDSQIDVKTGEVKPKEKLEKTE